MESTEPITRGRFLKYGGAVLGAGILAGSEPALSYASAADAVRKGHKLVHFSGTIGATSYPSTVLSVPILVAYKKGFFAKQKLDLKMVVMNSATDLAQALNGGQVTFGCGGILTVLSGYGAGLNNIRLIGQEDGAQYITFIAGSSTGITKPSQLSGKKIAVLTNTKNLSYWMALQMLKKGGLAASSVQFVFLESFPAIAAAVEQGVVDVGASFKPLSNQEAAAGKAKVIWDSGTEVLGYPDDGLFTTASVISHHSQAVQQFADAMVEAQAWVRQNVNAAATLWGKANQISPAITKQTLKSGGLAKSFTFPLTLAGFRRDRSLGVALQTVPSTLSYDAFVAPQFMKAAA